MNEIQDEQMRYLNREDLNDLMMFHVKHFRDYKISESSFLSYLDQDQYKVIAMFHVKHLIGYGIFLECNEEADLIYIGVIKDFRRSGIGKKLIFTFINENKIHRLFIEVSVTNAIALKFYISLGFQILRKRLGYYHGIDAYQMVLNLHSED